MKYLHLIEVEKKNCKNLKKIKYPVLDATLFLIVACCSPWCADSKNILECGSQTNRSWDINC